VRRARWFAWQLERQEVLLSSHADITRALALELYEVESALVNVDTEYRSQRAVALEQRDEIMRAQHAAASAQQQRAQAQQQVVQLQQHALHLQQQAQLAVEQATAQTHAAEASATAAQHLLAQYMDGAVERHLPQLVPQSPSSRSHVPSSHAPTCGSSHRVLEGGEVSARPVGDGALPPAALPSHLSSSIGSLDGGEALAPAMRHATALVQPAFLCGGAADDDCEQLSTMANDPSLATSPPSACVVLAPSAPDFGLGSLASSLVALPKPTTAVQRQSTRPLVPPPVPRRPEAVGDGGVEDTPPTAAHDCDAAYALFLSELATPQGSPIGAQVAAFVEQFQHAPPPPGSDASAHPDAIALRASLAALMAAAGPLQVTRRSYGVGAVRAGFERYVMGLLHARALGAGVDAVEDKVLHAQMATLSFVRAGHIGIAEELTQRPRWHAAQRCLLHLAAFSSPLDKMMCVAACISHLSALVDPHDGGFVPLTALALLAARPHQLHSHLEYAARFVNPDRLWAAELGGPLSIARAAVQWLAIQDPSAIR